ncbi:hypothetical protein [Mucilaginibacter sp. OK098]|uniref:hypothetical protein n=1 Tax=Mucilaginibacter sp. OK098 TaxID=1855297 RepID=UPI000916F61D|nr:hypothetical protein [Mucilaginibacter sp. OK098]SHN26207.1 hypothetical protein SAMN05216524_107391 [Mucilaginibacter sp. OK098]
MATQTTVHLHKYQHFEDLQLSAREFYALVRDMIAQYQYPDVTCTPVTLKEGGLFSSRRDYLRISRERYHYFLCASPFGRSFFISWWLQEDEHVAANMAKKIPLLGEALSTRLESRTYYELDTQLMFTSSINALITSAVEKVKLDKGFKASLING